MPLPHTAVPLPATSATQADGADATEAEAAPLTVEITPLETASVGTDPAETVSTVNPASVEASIDPGNPEEDVEEPRRRRRRSSASQAD